MVVGKLSDHGCGKIQGQAPEEGLLLFERKVTQSLSRPDWIASLQQSHGLVPAGLQNSIPNPLSNWWTHRNLRLQSRELWVGSVTIYRERFRLTQASFASGPRKPTDIPESVQHAYDGQDQNARCQKRPNHSVQELDRCQH